MVRRLVLKGFSSNGAKRAVLAVKGQSIASALAWAVEHNGDADFEHPVRIGNYF